MSKVGEGHNDQECRYAQGSENIKYSRHLPINQEDS